MVFPFRYDIMQRCWFSNAEIRPSFSDLKEELGDLLALSSDNLYTRQCTQDLSYTYYLNEGYIQSAAQYNICQNTYVRMLSDLPGYVNDSFDGRTIMLDSNGNSHDITEAKINGATAF